MVFLGTQSVHTHTDTLSGLLRFGHRYMEDRREARGEGMRIRIAIRLWCEH